MKFVNNFEVLKNNQLKLRSESKKLVFRILQKYSSNSKSEYYWLYCKYELLKYKPWHTSFNDALAVGFSNDEKGWIGSWELFLSSSVSKDYLPAGHNVLNYVISRSKSESDSDSDDSENNDDGNYQDLWQINQNVNNQSITKDDNNLIDNIEYWASDKRISSFQPIVDLPEWIRHQKIKYKSTFKPVNVDLKTLNKMQKFAYDIVESHHKNNTQCLLKCIGAGGEDTSR
jgi:hypothetical protein